MDYILYAGPTFDYLGTTDVGSDNFSDELTRMSAYVFISYSSKDREYADLIAMALKTIGLKVWWDADLLAGQTFDEQIVDALGKASAVIAVISKNSSHSRYTLNEWRYARDAGLPIFPVLIGVSFSEIPLTLRNLHAFVFDITDAHEFAVDLAYQINKFFGEIPQPSSEAVDEARRKLAASAAITAREVSKVPSDDVGKVVPDSVFVVHGHDEGMLHEMTSELSNLNIEPVILKQIRTSDDHIFAKFKAIASKARHAIVLISSDDVGTSFGDYIHPAGGISSLEFRARQNVILELGFFYGKLSEERVFVFRKPPPITEKLLGRFELPSDLSGKIFEDFSDDWRKILRGRLEQAGFKIDKEQDGKLSKSNF